MKIILGLVMPVSLALMSSAFAGGNDNVENQYFSINIPDSWTYVEGSDSSHVWLTPDEFSDIFVTGSPEQFKQKIQGGGFGLVASFEQDTDYPLKNAPLETYVKYGINRLGILKIISQVYTTIGKEKAVRIETNESTSFGNNTQALYFIMHGKQPYAIGYVADPKNYDKYLPEFEQMVKSLRFVDGASSESDGNLTNTKTNFSGANLTELSTSNTTKNQEELYNECVNVAGKSLCDFLFKR